MNNIRLNPPKPRRRRKLSRKIILEIIAGIVIPLTAILVTILIYCCNNGDDNGPLNIIEVVSLTSVIERDSTNSIKIKTSPNVPCTIKIDNEADQIDAESLAKNSDDSGYCDWSWEVKSDAILGDWKILLTAEGAMPREVKYTVTESQTQQPPYDIKLIHYTSPVQRGSDAKVTINTAPNVLCEIEVHLSSGISHAKGLESKDSDSNGNCTWDWHVSGNTTPGDWRIVIKVTGIGEEEYLFTVTDKV